ncbi:MAG TPA: c-type cytochrome [Candidatus Methylomirabilis sp.]|nr:c-type cytochrome [Candidatus Methylomirabilis sp.]
MLVVNAIALVAGALVVGSQLVSLLGGALGEAGGRRWRRTLARGDAMLAVLFILSAVVATRTGAWRALIAPDTRGLWAAGHAVAAGVWLGVLSPFALLLRGAAPTAGQTSRALDRAVWRVWGLALFLLAIVAATGVAVAGSLHEVPALVGTRYGRLLLLQVALFAVALGFMIFTSVRLVALLGGTDRTVLLTQLSRLLAIEVAVGVTMVIVAVMLTGHAAGSAEPTVWPFRFRLAPDVMLRFPSVQDQVITGTGIVVVGLLAVIGGYRVKAWRPLLLAAGALFLAIGLYKALAAMSIDAYPTTYARPSVGRTAESIRRGRGLFAVHCAPCHGPAGRGDGPAGAGLVQLPADLTASHTADHTPGDLFWWITHGLGLAMPAFGDHLSVTERWDLVNFVRTLTAGRVPLSASPTSVR